VVDTSRPNLWWDSAGIREARRRAQKPRAQEELWAWLVLRRFSIYLSLALARMRWVKPNHVTLAAAAIAVAAAAWTVAAAAPPSWLWLFGLYNLAYFLDCVDGEVARLTGATSRAGQWLDNLVQVALLGMSFSAGVRLLGPVAGRWFGLIILYLLINALAGTWLTSGARLALDVDVSAISVPARKRSRLLDFGILCLASDHGMFAGLAAIAALPGDYARYAPAAAVAWFGLHAATSGAKNLWRLHAVTRALAGRAPGLPEGAPAAVLPAALSAIPSRAGRRPHRLRWVTVAGWVYLAGVLALLSFRVVPARTALVLHAVGLPLYAAWAFTDYGSFLCASMVALGFVQVEPAPFDMLAPLILLAGLLTGALRPRLNAGTALIIAAVAWGLVSLPWWADAGQGGVFFGVTAYLCLLMLCFSWLDDPRLVRGMLRGCVIAGVAAVGLGLLALFWQGDYTSHLLYPGPVLGDNPLSFRVKSFFKDPNVFGAFAAAAALFALDGVLRRPRWGPISAGGPLLAMTLCCFGVLLSYSRGGLVNAACVLGAYLVYLLVRQRRLLLRLAALVAAAAVLVSVFFAYAGLWPALAERYQFHGYDTIRIAIQQLALTGDVPATTPSPGQQVTDQPAPGQPATGQPAAAPTTPAPGPAAAPTTAPPSAPDLDAGAGPPVPPPAGDTAGEGPAQDQAPRVLPRSPAWPNPGELEALQDPAAALPSAVRWLFTREMSRLGLLMNWYAVELPASVVPLEYVDIPRYVSVCANGCVAAVAWSSAACGTVGGWLSGAYELAGDALADAGLVLNDALGRIRGPELPSWAQRLFIGAGPGQFEGLYGRSAHSLYIRLLTEGGALQLCLFLAGMGLIVAASLRARRRVGWDSAGALLGFALLGILAQGATIDILHWRHFWIFLGAMPVACGLRLGRPPGGGPRP